jgi:pyruvate formate lyase activating enzyme
VIRITNIQRFCLNDGPGIRTTIFLKGCNLNCPWCANPENLIYNFEKYYDEFGNEKGVYGYDISAINLKNEILKDLPYYEKNGGVTFSGGEPFLQIDALIPLLKLLKNEKINICFETALDISTDLLQKGISYIDELYVDIKILDSSMAKKVLNADIDLYLKNLDFISKMGKCIIFRIPMSNEYTITDDNINKILKLLDKYDCKKVEIFKVHSLGEKKYKSLNKKMVNFSDVSDLKVQKILDSIRKKNIDVNYINFL